MLVLDTSDMPLHRRRSMITDAITAAAAATTMRLESPPGGVHLTMRSWDLLGGVEMVDAQCSAHTLRRTSTPRVDEEAVVALTWGIRGNGVNSQHDHEVVVGPSLLWATDISRPYVHHVSDTRTLTTKVPLRALGMAEDLVRPALQQVQHSPLAPLFGQHIMEVRRVADEVNAVAAVALGTATLALARAVLASVLNDERVGRRAMDDVLLARVKAFVLANLGDPDLAPASIAAANFVSVRHLYKACAAADLRLEQWIIGQRLERAREELARPTAFSSTVSATARRWGFTSPSYFARRFRSTYGVSPREWREMNRRRAFAVAEAPVP